MPDWGTFPGLKTSPAQLRIRLLKKGKANVISHSLIREKHSPLKFETWAGTLTIVDNAAGTPHTVGLSGTGAMPSLGLSVSSGGSSSQTVAAGNTATYNLSIGGQGASGTATFICTGAPTGAVCTPPASESVSASAASTFKVTVTTTARSAAALNSSWSAGASMWAIGVFGLLLVSVKGGARRQTSSVLAAIALFAITASLIGCASGNSTSTTTSTGTPSGTTR